MVEEWAGRGEWFCALVWAPLLGERGRQADAPEVLAPYTATGWWTAVAATAELLEGWGRIEEAIEVSDSPTGGPDTSSTPHPHAERHEGANSAVARTRRSAVSDRRQPRHYAANLEAYRALYDDIDAPDAPQEWCALPTAP